MENADTLPEIYDQEEADVQNEADEADNATDMNDGAIDYAALADEDLKCLRDEFYELSDIESITELDDPLRYGALRDLGLTPREAYLATRKARAHDNRRHLSSSVPRSSRAPLGTMSESELMAARELFDGLSDLEIRRLYKKVTK